MENILEGQNATFDMSINYNPDTVIIAFGTNDYYLYHSVELVVGAAKDYLSLVLVPHLRKFYADSFYILVITDLAYMQKTLLNI